MLIKKIVVLTFCSFILSTSVFAANQAPTMNGDQIFEGAKNQTLRFTLAGATDANKDALTYKLVSAPTAGTLKNCLNNTSNLRCEFTPPAEFRGAVTFTYRANDGITDSLNVNKVTLRYDLPNHAPVAGEDKTFSGSNSKPLAFTLPKGQDQNGDELVYKLISGPSSGSLSGCLDNTSTRTCTYTPSPTTNGVVTLTYKVSDGLLDSANTAKVELRIGSTNHAPVMKGDQGFGTTKFTLAGASDEDKDTLTYSLVSPATLPELKNCLNGTTNLNCEYIPATKGKGSVTFTYKANDGKEDSTNVSKVTINYDSGSTPTNNPPVAAMSCTTKSRKITCQSNSTDSDGSISKTQWQFNGETILGTSFTRIAPTDNTYPVVLTVWDDKNSSSSKSSSFNLLNALPQVHLTCVINGSSVNCDGTFSSDTDGTIESYSWDFGDGSSGTGVNVDHSYAQGGSYTITLKVKDDMGGESSGTFPVIMTPNQAPVSSFACTQKSRHISCNSTSTDADGTITAYSWLLDNQSVETQNISYDFTQDGTYTIRLTVWDDKQAYTSSEQTFTLENSLPTVDISCFQNGGMNVRCQALNAHDEDGSIVSYSWRADTEQTASGTTVDFTFSSLGEHVFVLTAVDDFGGQVIKTAKVVLEQNEVPWSTLTYQGTKGSGDVLFNVMKYDQENNLESAVIDFGDGQTLTLDQTTWYEQVSHTYVATGEYQAKLTLVDNVGNKNEESYTVYAGVTEKAWPVVDADAFQIAPLTVAAFTSFSYSPFYDIVEVKVEWGDGSSPAISSSPKIFRHNYSQSGNYNLVYTLTDASGRVTSVGQNLDVNDQSMEYMPTYPFPMYLKESGFNSIFRLTAYSLNMSTSLAQAHFEFGDGTEKLIPLGESTQSVPRFYHVFPEGSFKTVYTVKDANGGERVQKMNLVSGTADPFKARVRCFNIGLKVTCTGKGYSPTQNLKNASLDWSGEETSSASGIGASFYKDTFSHTFASSGTKTIAFTVEDESGATKTDTRQVILPSTFSNPVADFSCTKNFNEISCSANGSSASNGEILSYAWDFGDGGTGNGYTYMHTYTQDNSYTVKLTVRDSLGLQSTAQKTIVILPNNPPVAAFSCSVNQLTISCSAMESSDTDGIIQAYNWGFGDGSTATGMVVQHTYSSSGNFFVNLQVMDNLGGSGTTSKNIFVGYNNDSVSSTIYDIGGTLEISNRIRVNFGVDSYSVPTPVTVERSIDPYLLARYQKSSVFWPQSFFEDEVIRIIAASTISSKRKITIDVMPLPSFKAMIDSRFEIFPFLLEMIENGDEKTDEINIPIGLTYNSQTGYYTALIDGSEFNSLRRTDGRHEIVVSLGAVKRMSARFSDDAMSFTQGAALGIPNTGTLTVARAFHQISSTQDSIHHGVDYMVDKNENVIAPLSGKVIVVNDDIYTTPRGQSFGWSHYLLICGQEGIVKVANYKYATVGNGSEVRKGEAIAVPEEYTSVHFEYVPNSLFFAKPAKVNYYDSILSDFDYDVKFAISGADSLSVQWDNTDEFTLYNGQDFKGSYLKKGTHEVTLHNSGSTSAVFSGFAQNQVTFYGGVGYVSINVGPGEYRKFQIIVP